ncbi:MAG: hypothetical protein IPH31_13170 [Lewinellaceae bacterium]|nr:hypothetical protein [Lewinellaceae bacterium]
MTNAVSKEMLKSALVELAQSDRDFFISLLLDVLKNAQPDASVPSATISNNSNLKKPLPSKVNPDYRRNVKTLRKQYALDKSMLRSLQELFADAPNAEIIIASLRK